MAVTPDESIGDLSLLRKQLILAQVQILELQDKRDELHARLQQEARLLVELQGVADQAFAGAQQARSARAAAEAEVANARSELHDTQEKLRHRERDLASLSEQLEQSQTAVRENEERANARAERIAVLDNELRSLKTSRSWRWTAPLRAVERAFRRSS